MTATPIKVLVIDDEPPIRKLLRMGLTTQGYEILEAPNGKVALELMSQNPALIILDLGLPDIQGHELLRMIRGRNDSVPIVVLSSRGDEAGKVQALDLGADDYLTKPFGMDELLARLRAALRHQLQAHGERPVFRSGDLSVDLVRRIVKVGDREVRLSAEGAVGRTHRRAISAGLCAPAPAEDRSRPGATAICADRNRHRLPPAGTGLVANLYITRALIDAVNDASSRTVASRSARREPACNTIAHVVYSHVHWPNRLRERSRPFAWTSSLARRVRACKCRRCSLRCSRRSCSRNHRSCSH
jgi:CheY-like chemotaxis protein